MTAIPTTAELAAQWERARESMQTAFLAFNNQGSRGAALAERARQQSIAVDLRNSIGFRLDSVMVHLELLRIEQDQVLEELVSYIERGLDRSDELQGRAIMRRAATRQRHLFDDVAFAAVSAFDYFGNLVGLVNYGEPRRKMKWKRLIQYAKKAALERNDHHSTRIHDSSAATAALTVESDWLAQVSEYRADAIHCRVDAVNGHMTIEWDPGPTSVAFHAYVPPEFVRRMSRARVRPPHLAEEASLIPCAEWLAGETLSRIAILADALTHDIGPDPLASGTSPM